MTSLGVAINYTILKSSIIDSSLWVMEDSDTRCVWITLLAKRNKDGEVFSSLVGLSHAACVPIEKTEIAIKKFLAPDTNSTTKENEGRRLKEIVGGWLLLNHQKIKEEAQAANKAQYMSGYMKDKRAHQKIAKTLPTKGEMEYMAAVKRGAPQTELDAIVTKHLPPKPQT